MDPASHRRISRRYIVIAGVLVLVATGCKTTRRPAAIDDLDAPIFGGSKPTTYVLAPKSDVIHARDLAAVARILRRYKTLDAAERALVRSSVSRRLDALIALEVRSLEQTPRIRIARAEIRKIADRRVAAARTAALDADIRSEAMRALGRRLGGMIATPVRGSDNRSAVVFSRIDGARIMVQDSAYELDRPLASLTEGSSIQSRSGEVAKFVSSQPVAVAAPKQPR